MSTRLGQVIVAFFEDHLKIQKGSAQVPSEATAHPEAVLDPRWCRPSHDWRSTILRLSGCSIFGA